MVHNNKKVAEIYNSYWYICYKTKEQKNFKDYRTKDKLYNLHCKYCSECKFLKNSVGNLNYWEINEIRQDFKK